MKMNRCYTSSVQNKHVNVETYLFPTNYKSVD